MGKTTTGTSLTFHWRYIALPLVVFLLSIVIVAFFYSRLPVEVAYLFQSDGSPEKWLSRNSIVILTLIPQLIFALLAGAIALGMSMLSKRFTQPGSTGLRPERIISPMSNMVVMPQLVLCFAMLDILSYNSFQIHLLPLWIFALIVVVLGSIIIGVFFIKAIRQAHRVIEEKYSDGKNTS